MADIEDLEFLSPYLYYLLMPEIWPENRRDVERPVKRKASPKVEYNDDLYAKIKEIVPADDFVPGAKPEVKTGASDLRTINPDINSPLTGADVAGFCPNIAENQAALHPIRRQKPEFTAPALFLICGSRKTGRR